MRAISTQLRGMSYATRVKAGALALLALTALGTNLVYLRSHRRFDLDRLGRDDVSAKEKRLASLKQALPARGVVGYVSDYPDEIEATGHYYLAQYTLAPLVVVRGSDHPLVVGNFGAPVPAAPPAAGLVLIKDFGDGVVLFGREGR